MGPLENTDREFVYPTEYYPLTLDNLSQDFPAKLDPAIKIERENNN